MWIEGEFNALVVGAASLGEWLSVGCWIISSVGCRRPELRRVESGLGAEVFLKVGFEVLPTSMGGVA